MSINHPTAPEQVTTTLTDEVFNIIIAETNKNRRKPSDPRVINAIADAVFRDTGLKAINSGIKLESVRHFIEQQNYPRSSFAYIDGAALVRYYIDLYGENIQDVRAVRSHVNINATKY